MFTMSERVYSFKLMNDPQTGKDHLMVIRVLKDGYESWCRTQSDNWKPTPRLRPTCPTCCMVEMTFDEQESQ